MATTAQHPPASRGEAPIDTQAVRADFPALAREIGGQPVAYLDNAASSHRPRAVLDAERRCYEYYWSNVHRGVHTMSQEATEAYEGARGVVAGFIGAPGEHEIVFVRGTTEGVNLAAWSWGRANLTAGDEILVTELEHHSNFVPWQLLCEQTGAALKVVSVDAHGDIDRDSFEELLNQRTRLVAIAHVSNVLGTVVPIAEFAERAHAVGALVFVDGAQATPHLPVDVHASGADFYTFSGHKMFGPGGIGVLWARSDLFAQMPPWQSGGGMIERVSAGGTSFMKAPWRFEAGTPNIAGAVGLGAACSYLEALGMENIRAREAELLRYATQGLSRVDGVELHGQGGGPRASVLSFALDGVHPHDMGTVLDQRGVAIRVGHHCAQPLMKRLGVPATARASFAFYNTEAEIDRLVQGVEATRELFG